MPLSRKESQAIIGLTELYDTFVPLFSLVHLRWEFAFQPEYAAYWNLIGPWRRVLRSLALKGRRFEIWAETCQTAQEAAMYWSPHRYPFI